ncbi:MAG: agmatinase [Xanthomonadales bacterium]|nr:agmatinase [Xanthomonadales bacterium]
MTLEKLNNNDVALVGILSDANSSFKRGAAAAPEFIRQALHSGSANLCSELGVDLAENPCFVDVGDRQIGNDPESFLAIENEIFEIAQQGALPLVLGGDHAITYPVLRAINRAYGSVNILHFDAHPDLYHDYEGNPFSHASPFARIMEEGLAKRLVQIGIRTLNEGQRVQAERFGVEIHEMRSLDVNSMVLDFEGPVYISCDIDALDPAFAPGVSHQEPGGLSVRDILGIVQDVPNRIVGADLVEYNPSCDINDMTAMVAAKLLKEIAGRMLLNASL